MIVRGASRRIHGMSHRLISAGAAVAAMFLLAAGAICIAGLRDDRCPHVLLIAMQPCEAAQDARKRAACGYVAVAVLDPQRLNQFLGEH